MNKPISPKRGTHIIPSIRERACSDVSKKGSVCPHAERGGNAVKTEYQGKVNRMNKTETTKKILKILGYGTKAVLKGAVRETHNGILFLQGEFGDSYGNEAEAQSPRKPNRKAKCARCGSDLKSARYVYCYNCFYPLAKRTKRRCEF